MVPENLTLLSVTIACMVLAAHGDSETSDKFLASSESGIVKRETIDDIIGTLKGLASRSPDLKTVNETIVKNYERMQVYLSKISKDEMLTVVVKVNEYLNAEVKTGNISSEMAELIKSTVADLAKDRMEKDCPVIGPRSEKSVSKRETIEDIIGTLKGLASRSPDLKTVNETIAKNYERMQVYLSKISKDEMLTVVVKVNEYLDTEVKTGNISSEMAELIKSTVADLAKDRMEKDCPVNGATSVKFSLSWATVAALLTCSWLYLQ